MDISKLKDAVQELRAESARCAKLADDLDAVIGKNSSAAPTIPAPAGGQKRVVLIGTQRPVVVRGKADPNSYLSVAVDVLREQRRPMHIKEIVPLVAQKRGGEATRASVESALVRGMKTRYKGIVKRQSIGTFVYQGAL